MTVTTTQGSGASSPPTRWCQGTPPADWRGEPLKSLTVDFHEPGFVSTLNGENQQPCWFQMSSKQKQEAGSPRGPAHPQSLNRYSYTLNNPLRWTDPSGHAVNPPWDHCNQDLVNISTWSEPAQGAAALVCGLTGCCNVDGNRAVITGPAREQYVGGSVTGMMPATAITKAAWVKNAGSFVGWMKNIEALYQTDGLVLDRETPDMLVREADRLGVIVRLDEAYPAYARPASC